VLHPVHNADDRARLQALADFFGLVVSGGSDWHAVPDHPRVLGLMQVPLAVLERQDERVAARRRAGTAGGAGTGS
jgi:hypothetical protein